MNPKLSILIPSVPGRLGQARLLFEFIWGQNINEASNQAEILMLCDNRQRSIGAKRQALVDIARGDYLAFVDDDDNVCADYINALLSGIERFAGADVLTFPTLSQIDGGPLVRAEHSLRNENEQYNPAGFKRKPWMMHAWRRELTQSARFPERQIAEDAHGVTHDGWLDQLWAKAKTEQSISNEPLYIYQFARDKSEAIR